jgi:hypothetical protein
MHEPPKYLAGAAAVLDFLESTYEAGAILGKWYRGWNEALPEAPRH